MSGTASHLPDGVIERLGSRRLWFDETGNGLLGVTRELVAGYGHRSVFIWNHATGECIHKIDAQIWRHGDRPDQAIAGAFSDDERQLQVRRLDGTHLGCVEGLEPLSLEIAIIDGRSMPVV